MASAFKMIVAGVSSIAVLISLAIYVIIIGPIEAHLIPILKIMTPPNMWTFLGGDMILWIFPFVYFLLVACAILIVVRLFHQASETSGYENQR